MSLRALVAIAIIVIVIAFGTALTLRHALRIDAARTNLDTPPPRPAPAAPR